MKVSKVETVETMQWPWRAPSNQKPTSRQPMRKGQTPSGHEPKPAKTATQKNCLTLLSDALKKDETGPKCKNMQRWNLTTMQNHAVALTSTSKPKTNVSATPAKQAKHHLDTSPNQPKPQRKKVPNVAFWCPKERWNWTMQKHQRWNLTTQNHAEALTSTSKPKTNVSATPAKQPNTIWTRAQTSQNRNAKKGLTLTFWCPKERWNWTMQKHQRWNLTTQNHAEALTSTSKPKTNVSATPAKQPNTIWTRAQTSQSKMKPYNAKPNWTSLTQKPTFGNLCETAKHHLGHELKPENRKKKCLTLLSDALKKDETGPCKNIKDETLPRKTTQRPWRAPPNQKPTSRQPLRNSQTPSGHEPKPANSAT